MTFEDLCKRIGNKSVFDQREMLAKYQNYRNLAVIEMLYYGYFGTGHNVNNAWLSDNGFFSHDEYPANIKVSPNQFRTILKEGNIDESNVIIN